MEQQFLRRFLRNGNRQAFSWKQANSLMPVVPVSRKERFFFRAPRLTTRRCQLNSVRRFFCLDRHLRRRHYLLRQIAVPVVQRKQREKVKKKKSEEKERNNAERKLKPLSVSSLVLTSSIYFFSEKGIGAFVSTSLNGTIRLNSLSSAQPLWEMDLATPIFAPHVTKNKKRSRRERRMEQRGREEEQWGVERKKQQRAEKTWIGREERRSLLFPFFFRSDLSFAGEESNWMRCGGLCTRWSDVSDRSRAKYATVQVSRECSRIFCR